MRYQLKKKGGNDMPKKIIGFECSQEFKDRAIKAGQNYQIDGNKQPVSLSMFCRIAVANLMYDIENSEKKKENK